MTRDWGRLPPDIPKRKKRHGLKIKLQIEDPTRTLGAVNHVEKKESRKAYDHFKDKLHYAYVDLKKR